MIHHICRLSTKKCKRLHKFYNFIRGEVVDFGTLQLLRLQAHFPAKSSPLQRSKALQAAAISNTVLTIFTTGYTGFHRGKLNFSLTPCPLWLIILKLTLSSPRKILLLEDIQKTPNKVNKVRKGQRGRGPDFFLSCTLPIGVIYELPDI